MKKIMLFVLCLMLLLPMMMNVSAERIPVASLDYPENDVVVIQGDVTLEYDHGDGLQSDLSISKLSYDNSSDMTFYMVMTNDLSSQIDPEFDNSTKTYSFQDSVHENPPLYYEISINYASVEVPEDPTERIQDLESQVENLSIFLENMSVDNQELEQQVINLTTQLNETTHDNQDLQRNISFLEDRLAERITTITELETDLSEKEDIIDDLSAEIEDIEDLEERIDDLRLDKTMLNNSIQYYKNQISDMQTSVQQLKDPFSMGYEENNSWHPYINLASLLIGFIICGILLLFLMSKYRSLVNAALSTISNLLPNRGIKRKKIESYPEQQIRKIEDDYLKKHNEKKDHLFAKKDEKEGKDLAQQVKQLFSQVPDKQKGD